MLINSEWTFRDVNKVTMSYLLVKNFDSKSLIAIDAKQTQQFTVKKIKFNQTDNLIFANRYLEFRRPHCFYSHAPMFPPGVWVARRRWAVKRCWPWRRARTPGELWLVDTRSRDQMLTSDWPQHARHDGADPRHHGRRHTRHLLQGRLQGIPVSSWGIELKSCPKWMFIKCTFRGRGAQIDMALHRSIWRAYQTK